ncbi:MAG: hypothetical protein QG592_1349 [Pseudomonadota bacterium]|nr:hypothetical protein [Pseudomonadota bacterium]
MRHYAPDSPEASARIIALALLADGAIDLSEIDSIRHYKIVEKIGIGDECFNKVIRDFCEDMLVSAHRTTAGQLELDRDTVVELLGDIRQPAEQHKLLRSILDIINSDGSLAGSEAVLVSEAMKRWEINLLDVSRVDPPRVRRWASPVAASVPTH